ncbi:cupin domain-containing protein [Candidatus Woesebacteria bacterium]|nr:cupin domain-containing protein [Candidatus Woesebacteria bacterium]
MTGFVQNIEQLTLQNTNFRQVLYTAEHAQLVVMNLLPNEEIGEEVHESVDQFLRIEQGEGIVVIDGQKQPITDGTAILIPAGSKHNVINTSSQEAMKLYTIYSPAHHRDGVIHATKQEAEADTSDHL